ncbi:hypothetical protein CICLE_v10006845mg [Citrus x clementina]|uniref:DUF7806 domain-containing protein n=1 Tax=Citrus clementina TaxID=85681 RepID=V4RJD2_CITCL|nr:hypothetical protein CICLE_v10006845mg [Citrus x clementina]
MESLYKKLYDKYDKLKKKKFSELDNLNKEQELKFTTYVNAADKYIEFLRSENEKSTSNEQCLHYQKLLMEENQKNKALSEEVETLQKLLQEGTASSSKDDNNDNMQLYTPEGAQPTSGNQSKEKTRKRRRKLRVGNTCLTWLLLECDVTGLIVCIICFLGGGEHDSGPANCLFQALIEYLFGMKLSPYHESEGRCVSALHQSTGYSFSLTWVKSKDGEEFELLYRVLSLGTLERVALGWMMDEIMFSTSMCPIFFERISRVIK